MDVGPDEVTARREAFAAGSLYNPHFLAPIRNRMLDEWANSGAIVSVRRTQRMQIIPT